MLEKLSAFYLRGYFKKERIHLLNEKLRTAGVDLDVIELQPTAGISVIDGVMITFHMSPGFWEDNTRDSEKDAMIEGIVQLFMSMSVDDQDRHASGGKKQSKRKLFFRVTRQINNHHIQHFLMSTKLSGPSAFAGLVRIAKASKKYIDKKPVINGPYREEYIRLRKDASWRRIKDVPKFREKLQHKEKRKKRDDKAGSG